MESESTAPEAAPFQEGDRVRRSDATGPSGTVTKVRIERTRASIKEDGKEPPGVTVTVLWDNGTLSHFVPDSLTSA